MRLTCYPDRLKADISNPANAGFFMPIFHSCDKLLS